MGVEVLSKILLSLKGQFIHNSSNANILLKMRVLLVINLLILCIGIGYSFRITAFLDPFFKHDNHHNEHERQSTEVGDQIIPLFGITFIATLIMNYFLNQEQEGKKYSME